MSMLVLALALPASAGSYATKGTDNADEGCHGRCDDATITYEVYNRALDEMINQLQAAPDITPQLDEGWGVVSPGGLGGDNPVLGSAPVLADVYTVQSDVEDNLYFEHWFLDNDSVLDDPGAAFSLTFVQQAKWVDLAPQLLADDPGGNQTYLRMAIHYASLPSAVSTAQLGNPGASVWSAEFSGVNDGDEVAHLRREVHMVGGVEVRRIDHWVFAVPPDGSAVGNHGLLDEIGEQLQLDPVPNSGATSTFYGQFQAKPSNFRAAVVEYDISVAADALFDPNFDGLP